MINRNIECINCKLQFLKSQNRLDEHELQSAKRNLNDTLSQMMKNRRPEEIAQIMDALENESEDETESNSEDENDRRYQPDYDNNLNKSLEEAIEEVTGGVPLRVRYLILFNFSIDEYEGHELPSILCSLNKL